MNESWAVITGASSGIGAAFARELARRGYHLVLVARSEEKMAKLAVSVEEETGCRTRIVPLDLRMPASIPVLAEQTADLNVRMVINNAGFGTSGPFVDIDDDREADMIALNCTAVTRIARLYCRRMADGDGGAMIIVASTASMQPCPWFATYAATKVFDRFLAEALWFEMKPKGVDVLALNPGATATGFFDEAGIAETPKGAHTPELVVKTAMKALGKKPSVVVGAKNRMLAFFGRFTPEKLLIRIAAAIMKQMGA